MRRLLPLLACCGPSTRAPVPAPPAHGSAPRPVDPDVGTWVALIDAGAKSAIVGLASGPHGTFAVIAHADGAFVVNGTRIAEATTTREGPGLVHFDLRGVPRGAGVLDINFTTDLPIHVGASDAVVGGRNDDLPYNRTSIHPVTSTAELGPPIAVAGIVDVVTRTPAGVPWIAAHWWGSDDALAEGRCDGDAVIARRGTDGAFVPLYCGTHWGALHLTPIGDAEVVACGVSISGNIALGRVTVPGRSFVARFAADGSVRWARPIAELGHLRCDAIAVAPDGDVVVTGTATDNLDFTEDPHLKGVVERATDGSPTTGHTELWLARFTTDGTRRFGKRIGGIALGSSPTLGVARDGTAIVGAGLWEPLDLGDGPVADPGAVVAAIDRGGGLRGYLPIATADIEGIAIDGADGVVIGLQLHGKDARVGAVVVPAGLSAVVRVPLPLPTPTAYVR